MRRFSVVVASSLLALVPPMARAKPETAGVPMVGKALTEARGNPNHMVAGAARLYWSEEQSQARMTPGLFSIGYGDGATVEVMFEGENVYGLALADEDLVFALGGKTLGSVMVMPAGTTEARTVMSGKNEGFTRVEALVASGRDVFASFTDGTCKDRPGILAHGSVSPEVDPVIMANTCAEDIAVGEDRVVWVEYRGKDSAGKTRRDGLMSLPRNAVRESSTPTELTQQHIYEAPVILGRRVFFVVGEELLSLPLEGGQPALVAKDFRRKLFAGDGGFVGVSLFGGKVGMSDGKSVTEVGNVAVKPFDLVTVAALARGRLFFGAADGSRGGIVGIATPAQ